MFLFKIYILFPYRTWFASTHQDPSSLQRAVPLVPLASLSAVQLHDVPTSQDEKGHSSVASGITKELHQVSSVHPALLDEKGSSGAHHCLREGVPNQQHLRMHSLKDGSSFGEARQHLPLRFRLGYVLLVFAGVKNQITGQPLPSRTSNSRTNFFSEKP